VVLKVYLINVQQNFFNPTSNSLEILKVQHYRRVVPRMDVLIFYKQKASSIKQIDLRDMFKKASKNICT
jgi:hypothetical protein